MNGFVDDSLRALISVPVAATSSGDRTELAVWIDTAFNGGLVLPRKSIESLGLVKESSAEAILADGKTVELETYACFSIGLMRPTKRRSSRTMVSIHYWVLCCCRGVNLRLTMMLGLSK